MPSNEYWAGLFDGEGCVMITNMGRVQVSVTQKNPEVLQILHKEFGGHIYVKSSKILDPISHWKATGKGESLVFLSAIYPYSIIKKKEIEIGIRALDLVHKRNIFDGCTPLTDSELDERLGLRIEMQSLRPNKKFKCLISEEKIYRDRIKTLFDFRCSKCNSDLKNLSPIYQIIRDNKLICRKCNALMNIKEIKPLTREQIEDALNKTSNLNDACKILGVNRASLYCKRKHLGMPSREHSRGTKNQYN